MKRFFSLIGFIILLFIIAGCSNNSIYVSFDTNSIENIDNIQIKKNTVLPLLEKTGYVFSGWYLDQEFLNVFILEDYLDLKESNVVIKLYARWTLAEYQIYYLLDGGENASTNPNKYNLTSQITFSNPSKEGYTFIGWYDNANYSGNVVTSIMTGTTGDKTLHAKWSANQYTINFVSNGGSSVASITQNYNTTVVKPQNPVLYGHTFDGWYTNANLTIPYVFASMPLSNVTLYAKWIVNVYTINYILDEGVNSLTNPDSYNVNGLVVLSNPTKEGHTFSGWYDNENYNGNVVTSIMTGTTGDKTLYAKWSINNYNITYSFTTDNYDPISKIILRQDEMIINVLGSYEHSSALTSDGRLFIWGRNDSGQLGDNSIEDKTSPIDITTLFNLSKDDKIIQVSLGYFHSSALTSNGRIFMWGYNSEGELGDDTTIDKIVPTEITGQFNLLEEDKIIQVYIGGFHSSALTSNGRIFMWGYNENGQLGDNTTTNKLVPTEVTNYFNLAIDDKIVQVILGGSHTSALTLNGRIFMWGYNEFGQLGNNSTTNRLIPTEITNRFNLASEDRIIQISMGRHHSSALTLNGRTFTWGLNIVGQLGDITQINKLIPVEITNRFNLTLEDRIIQISMGGYHSSAVTFSGKIYVWGYNEYGQLGDNTTTNKLIPFEITNQFNLDLGDKIKQVSLGFFHSSILTTNHKFFVWGNNNEGQLGDSTIINKGTPTLIDTFVNVFFDRLETYEYGEIINEILPTKEGFTFSGWYEKNSSYVLDKMPARDLVLYGWWIPNE